MIDFFKGEFEINGVIIPNTVVGEGMALLLRDVFRGEAVLPANYYLGMTNAAIGYASTLADAAALEPSGHGYARQALARNTTDWTVELVNGIYRARSKTVTFTASSNYTQAVSRFFVSDQAAGTAGAMFAASGPFPNPITFLSGAGPTAGYIFPTTG